MAQPNKSGSTGDGGSTPKNSVSKTGAAMHGARTQPKPPAPTQGAVARKSGNKG